MSSTATRLELPFTGQALRQAVARRDIAALLDMAGQLRVAGYRVEPQRLAAELLNHGVTTVVDAFGQTIPLQVQVPPALAQQLVDERVSFRIAA